jgi:hypothetical protein
MIEKLRNPDKGYVKHVAAFQRISGEESSKSCGFVCVASSFIQLRLKKNAKCLKKRNTRFFLENVPKSPTFHQNRSHIKRQGNKEVILLHFPNIEGKILFLYFAKKLLFF